MSEIKYVKGDATVPNGRGKKVITHICNDQGGWGAGFVVAISKRWPYPEHAYRELFDKRADQAKLGFVQFIHVDPNIFVANMIAQHAYGYNEGPPIRYDAVRTCLEKVAEYAIEEKASVHMPRIGCGLAGGRWEEIEPIINETLIAKGLEVTVYDFGN